MSVQNTYGFAIATGLFAMLMLVAVLTELPAQQPASHYSVARTMRQIPDSLTYSTDDIAGYINRNLVTPREKSRAAFTWITRNIRYNFDSILTNTIYETPAEISERILRTRTGVCLNFAHLYNEIANKTGVKSYVIQGYTRQNGRVDYLPHVWCASFTDTTWYIVDPTWRIFMQKPVLAIRTHMPFDPLWQLIHHPVRYDDFKKGDFRPKTSYFSFTDTLKDYENATELEKATAAARRIAQNGEGNAFTAAKLRIHLGDIEYLRNKMAAERYDSAVDLYNKGIQLLNQFIGHRNNQFSNDPNASHSALLLDSSCRVLEQARNMLYETHAPDPNITLSIALIKSAVIDTIAACNTQKVFLDNYLQQRKE